MIYTAIVGDRDPARKDIKMFGERGGFATNRMSAKIFKVLAHLYWDEATVWVDGNIFPLLPEWELMARCLSDADLALFRHPFRKNIKDEYSEIKGLGLTAKCPKFPDGFADNHLFECGVMLRRHNAAVTRFNEIWWSLICRYSERDQLTFPIALHLVPELRLFVIPGNVRKHPWFKYVPHAK